MQNSNGRRMNGRGNGLSRMAMFASDVAERFSPGTEVDTAWIAMVGPMKTAENTGRNMNANRKPDISAGLTGLSASCAIRCSGRTYGSIRNGHTIAIIAG